MELGGGGGFDTRKVADVDAIASTATRMGVGIWGGMVSWTDRLVSSVSFCEMATLAALHASCQCIKSSMTCTGLACGIGRKPWLEDVTLGASISSVMTFLSNGTMPVFQNTATIFSLDSACV